MANWSNRVRAGASNDETTRERLYLTQRLALTNPDWHWQDFATASELIVPNVAGTGTQSKLRRAWRISSGAGASGGYLWVYGDNAAPSLFIPGGTAAKWGFVCRLAVSSAVDAQTFAWNGCLDTAGGSWLRVGFIGSLNLGTYTVQCDGVSVNTGVAKDNNFHTFRVWRTGGTTTVEVDGVVTNTSGTLFPANDCGPYGNVNNNATAAARTLDQSYLGILVERA